MNPSQKSPKNIRPIDCPIGFLRLLNTANSFVSLPILISISSGKEMFSIILPVFVDLVESYKFIKIIHEKKYL